MKPNTPTKAVIYARVSSREQEETGYSLPEQERFLKEYVERNTQHNLKITKVFSISESAAGRTQRKIFAEMMRYLEEKNINVVIVETTDRLTRNFKDVPAIDAWVCENEHRQIHLVKEGCVLHRDAKSHEWFMWRVKVATAEYYIRLLSENVKKGQKGKILDGWLPTKPPVGYKTLGEKGKKIHVIDEDTAPYVSEMFKLYATGNYSIDALTTKLFDKGLRNRNGNKVVKSRIHILLQDPFYYGDFLWNGEIHKGKHKPLISKKLFDEVQAKLHKTDSGSPYYRKHLYTLRGKIKCGKCKKTVSWENQKGQTYGGCKQCRAQLDTDRKYIHENTLEDALVAKMVAVAPKSARVLEVLEKALKESHSEEIAYFEAQKKSVTDQMTRIEQRMATMYDDRLDGRITGQEYDDRIKSFKSQITVLQTALNDLQDNNHSYYQAGFAVHELATYADRIYRSENATTEQRRLLLSYALKNVEVFMGDINVEYTPTFMFLAEWMPKVNTAFEQSEKAEETASVKAEVHSHVIEEAKNLVESEKQIRTGENVDPERQNGTFVPSHPILLRR